MLSESAIVAAVADHAARRITRKVVADLQRMKCTLSGDDSELESTWDEICAQVQDGELLIWDAYDETVKAMVCTHVSELHPHERDALWLQTEMGIDWAFEESEVREQFPVTGDDIVEYVTRDYVYTEAGRWSNERIRAFIDRSGRTD